MIRLFHSRRSEDAPAGEPNPHRLLTEYVLNMSITCLGDEDVTPLYEEYIKDSRLGRPEKEELTEVYRSLLPRMPSGPFGR
ncbi:MAG TPA: hypothetical protein VF992_03215 [Thermoplasmata archaeon]